MHSTPTESDHGEPISKSQLDQKKQDLSADWKNLNRDIEITQSFFSFASSRQHANNRLFSLWSEQTVTKINSFGYATLALYYLNDPNKKKDVQFIKKALEIPRILIEQVCDLETPDQANMAKKQLIPLMQDIQNWLIKYPSQKGKSRLLSQLIYIINQIRKKIRNLPLQQVSNNKFLKDIALTFIIQTIQLITRTKLKLPEKSACQLHKNILTLNGENNMIFIEQIIGKVGIDSYWQFIQISKDDWGQLEDAAPENYFILIGTQSVKLEQEQKQILKALGGLSLIPASHPPSKNKISSQQKLSGKSETPPPPASTESSTGRQLSTDTSSTTPPPEAGLTITKETERQSQTEGEETTLIATVFPKNDSIHWGSFLQTKSFSEYSPPTVYSKEEKQEMRVIKKSSGSTDLSDIDQTSADLSTVPTSSITQIGIFTQKKTGSITKPDNQSSNCCLM